MGMRRPVSAIAVERGSRAVSVGMEVVIPPRKSVRIVSNGRMDELTFKHDKQQPHITNNDKRLLPRDIQPFRQRTAIDDPQQDLSEQPCAEDVLRDPFKHVEEVEVAREDEEILYRGIMIGELRWHF